MKLLIVDDSRVIRNRIQRSLDSFGLTLVGSACNGAEAVAMAGEHQPDIVTMDLTMPEMDGIECTRNLVELNPDVLILVVSALSDKATAIEALKAGAHGFLCKPFSEQEISDAMVELIWGTMEHG